MAAVKKIDVTPTGVPIPQGLGARGRELFVRIATDFDLSGSFDRIQVLEQAARALDVVTRLQAFVDQSDELRSLGSMRQAVALPELVELRHWQKSYLSALQLLNCESDEDAEDRDREPGKRLSHSERGRMGARVRWGGATR